jgi:uncharacterized protein (DUF2141 family)
MKSLRSVLYLSTFLVAVATALSSPSGYAGQQMTSPKPQQAAVGSAPLIFLPPVEYSTAIIPWSVAVADLNGDGKPDLVTASDCQVSGECSSGGVSVLLGNGDGTFQAAVGYSSGGYQAYSVAIADVNGDGKLDLIVTNQAQCAECSTGTVSVLLGNGDGTFQAPVSYNAGPSNAHFVAIGDLNHDGHPDLVVANCANEFGGLCSGVAGGPVMGAVSVLLNNGDGTFKAPVTYSSGGWEDATVAIADLNGDGKPDLVATNLCRSQSDCENGSVGVLLGNGDGTFQSPVTYSSGPASAAAVAIADLNGDGHLDLVVGGPLITVLLGNGDGTFQPPVGVGSNYNIFSVAIEDVNGDGKLDLVTSGFPLLLAPTGGVNVFLGNGDGTFQTPMAYGQSSFTSLAIADVNGDGKPDLLVADLHTASVGVLLNNDGATPSTTALVSSVNPVDMKQTVTYTATVASASGGAVKGSVVFQDGVTIATVPLTNNQAAYTTSYTQGQLGQHAVTATYSGSYSANTGSLATLTEFVRGDSTATTITTSGSPSLVGQPVTFTANVKSHFGKIPDGEMISFYDGKTLLGSVALAAGQAAFTTSTLSVKKHSIKAAYPGDTTFYPSSRTLTQTVNSYETTTTLSSNPNPSNFGQTVIFTAHVTTTGSTTPTGTVIFKNGTTNLGKATLNAAGVATFATTKLPVGTNSLTAAYNGDALNGKSTSTAISQVVQ